MMLGNVVYVVQAQYFSTLFLDRRNRAAGAAVVDEEALEDRAAEQHYPQQLARRGLNARIKVRGLLFNKLLDRAEKRKVPSGVLGKGSQYNRLGRRGTDNKVTSQQLPLFS
ncbi:lipid-A-disaccharide synthase [Babesia caballi]|uniref:Lipid-A-disaccharide synthase n=1 Tax=Babesia caballi TaxID=5871 RepID=A0AAV4LVG0_BABCB|nr:lipid-A-disaccharide synthase [Babesia caballi]